MPVVLIIGGGIAGTAAALALGKAAIDATIYEAHPLNSHDRGAFLTLASNGSMPSGNSTPIPSSPP
jgi:2-polyprenyl-6-methoxyphenol hydroxylase-like FAD-dependent oxidoreductase